MRTLAALVMTSAFLGAAVSARAVDVPGGGKKKSDCYAGFSVVGTSNSGGGTLVSTKRVDQPACDGSCTFQVQLCTNVPVTNCTPAAVTTFQLNPENILFPPSADRCGETKTITVPLNGNKAGKVKIKVKAQTADGKPKNDPDTLVLKCNPNPNDTGCTPGCPQPDPAVCAPNPSGGPSQLTFTVLNNGTDLDNGWTGTSHNFPVPSNSKLKFCLCNCNDTDNPDCTGQGATGPNSLNGTTFGPPLPLIAGGVPVCVVNRFNGPVTGGGNLQTGEASGMVNLFSDVYVTDATRVCPRCNGGNCDSGTRVGQACTVDGQVLVAESLAQNKIFQLSQACPPGGTPVGTLNITLPVTTGTSTLSGSKPCREREAQGVPVLDDACGAAGCGADCQPGSKACETMAPSPIDPTQMVCIDSKGGISQKCCMGDAATPCFPTGGGGPGIMRTGRPVPPTPAWPDPTYPKSTTGTVMVATFCEAATTRFTVDQVAGLPGPGALIFNTSSEWTK